MSPLSSSIRSAALAAAIVLVSSVTAASASTYKLADSYTSQNLASDWDFFSQQDPTHGFVQYVTSEIAQQSLMAGKTPTGNIFLGSDKGANNGARQAVRISTKKAYNHHLMIADVVHFPVGSGAGGSCGLWPALWELGSGQQWPYAGEIDILEGVNSQQTNQMTLHTGPGCQVTNNQQAMSGNMTFTDCNVSNGANGNAGCSVKAQGANAASSYGSGFNAAGGGVFATEVSADGIKIWHFPRSAIPQDVATNPDPSGWGQPDAAFSGCNVDQHFQNLQIIVNTAFCGDWAGKVWNQPQAGGQPSCAQLTGTQTCEAYVAAHPEAFEDAYWNIKSINIFTQDGGAAVSSSASPSSAAAAAASAPAASSAPAAAPATAPAAASAAPASAAGSGSAVAIAAPAVSAATSPVPATENMFAPINQRGTPSRIVRAWHSQVQRDGNSGDSGDSTGGLFSQPSGDAYANCQQFTPGHCGNPGQSNERVGSNAATMKLAATATLQGMAVAFGTIVLVLVGF